MKYVQVFGLCVISTKHDNDSLSPEKVVTFYPNILIRVGDFGRTFLCT